MGSKAMGGASVAVAFALVFCFVRGAAGAATDCSVSFSNLQPCIEYVNANSSAPPSAICCKAFGSVQSATPVCLCQLLQAFADPKTAPGNITRALAIPTLCNVPVDPKRCAALTGTPTPAPVAAPPPAVVAPVTPPPAGAPAPVAAPGPTGANVDCTNAFNDLSSCLSFVTGSGKGVPPKDCCTALGKTQKAQPVCLCQLLAQASNSSSLGVNVTLATSLPQLCKVPADTSKCPALLGSPVSAPVAPVAPVAASPMKAPLPAPTATPAAPAPLPDCSTEFSNLLPCFTYVRSNDSSAPPKTCCTVLSLVFVSKPVCLCELLQMAGSNSSGVNVTKSLALPGACKVPVDPSKCPGLLGQPVVSPSTSPTAGPPAPPVGSPTSSAVPVTPGASPPITSPSKPGGSSASTSRATLLSVLLPTLVGFGGLLCIL